MGRGSDASCLGVLQILSGPSGNKGPSFSSYIGLGPVSKLWWRAGDSVQPV